VAIVCNLAKATLPKNEKIDWDGLRDQYDRIRDIVEKVVPGFENYNSRVANPVAFICLMMQKQNRLRRLPGKRNSLLPIHMV
jgi:hypothetical protein